MRRLRFGQEVAQILMTMTIKRFISIFLMIIQTRSTWSHNRVEGKLEYISLLYIPSKAPFDLWQRDMIRGLKLYVQRTFIMDEVEQFLPLYLRFVRGVIDSNDLPLNVSRELLQQDPSIDSIRNASVKRILIHYQK